MFPVMTMRISRSPVWSDRIERDVCLQAADLSRLDLIFTDTTTPYFETGEADEDPEDRGGRLFAPLRRRGHDKEDTSAVGPDESPYLSASCAASAGPGVPRDRELEAGCRMAREVSFFSSVSLP
jgi:hypothetical protein